MRVPAHRVTVYRGDYSGAIGEVSDYTSSSVTWQHNGVGTGTLVADEDVEVPAPVDQLTRNLDQVVPVVVRDAGRLWTGRVAHAEREGRPGRGTVTATLVEDWAWLRAILAWPVPGAAISAQTSVYDTRTGPVETAVKGYLSAAITRLRLPCAVVPAPPAGTDTSPSDYPVPTARFTPMDELLLPMLAATGRRLTARLWLPGDQPIPGLTLTSWTIVFGVEVIPRAAHVIWSDELGIVTRRVATTSPSAVRAVVGMKGEELERLFTEVVNTPLAALLGAAAFPEVMVEATDLDNVADGQARGLAKLREDYGPKAAVSFEVADGAPYTLGSDYDVGSLVRARTGGVLLEDVCTRATSTDSASEGHRITPQIGATNATETTEELLVAQVAQLVAAIAASRRR
ncbi:hypothetical protein TEK04_19595 [Klenkia sp. LSe6-5]|uniref:Gp28/Gp37-like domain-containing protein n=1 Tax=Klenkia sesuvii TaxID=3103137 RepID=A0ABU8DZI5_9ACTN